VKEREPVEGLPLEGNLAHRRGRDDDARGYYTEADRLARDACD